MIEAGFCNDKIGEYRYTIVLLRPPYAGAEYTTSFSDNFKSRIFTQLFGDEALSGAYKPMVLVSSLLLNEHRSVKTNSVSFWACSRHTTLPCWDA